MNVPPVWFPVAYVTGPSGDASGGEIDTVPAPGGAHGVGPCSSVRQY